MRYINLRLTYLLTYLQTVSSVSQKYNINNIHNMLSYVSSYLYCRILSEGLLCGAEHDLSVIAEFLM